MSEELYRKVYDFVSGREDEYTHKFVKENRDYLYVKGNSKKTVFKISTNPEGDEVLFRSYKGSEKEVVHESMARAIITKMHRPDQEGPCNPQGINALTRAFCRRYFIHGIQKIVTEVKQQCTGTCILTKEVPMSDPPPKPIRTSEVMGSADRRYAAV